MVGEAGLEPGDQLGLDEFELEHDKSVVVVTADIESPPVTFESAVLEATNLHQRSWSIDRVCRSRDSDAIWWAFGRARQPGSRVTCVLDPGHSDLGGCR